MKEARVEGILSQAWKMLDVDPQFVDASFRSIFTLAVSKQPDAPVLTQLDITLGTMQKLDLKVEPPIFEIRKRLAGATTQESGPRRIL